MVPFPSSSPVKYDGHSARAGTPRRVFSSARPRGQPFVYLYRPDPPWFFRLEQSTPTDDEDSGISLAVDTVRKLARQLPRHLELVRRV